MGLERLGGEASPAMTASASKCPAAWELPPNTADFAEAAWRRGLRRSRDCRRRLGAISSVKRRPGTLGTALDVGHPLPGVNSNPSPSVNALVA